MSATLAGCRKSPLKAENPWRLPLIDDHEGNSQRFSRSSQAADAALGRFGQTYPVANSRGSRTRL
jgi:hypothetical protein